MLPAFLTTILFSISGVCAQRTSKALGGLEANFWRIILATFLLALWAHTIGQGISGPAFPMFLLSGALGFGLGDIALYQALPRIGSRLSILLAHCVAAPFAAMVEWLWLGTKMSSTEILGAVLILAGVALALAPGKHLEIPWRTFWIGVVCGIIAALGQGMGAVLSGHASRVDFETGTKIDGLTAAYQRILAGLVVAVAFWIGLKLKIKNEKGKMANAGESNTSSTLNPQPSTLNSSPIWPWVVANALSGEELRVGCYQWALMKEKSGVVLPIVALTPLVIIPFPPYVEGERPRKRSLAGGLVAVLGVVILRMAAKS